MTPAARAGSAGARIEFHGVGKRYDTLGGDEVVHALERIDCTVESGQFVALIGPSGCGKSTLLNLTAGLLPVDAGTILFDGAPVRGPVSGVGMVFQVPALLKWRRVLENVLLPLDFAGRVGAAQREAARAMLAMVGLAGFESRYPFELSGGMQQRVALARALIHDPRILLMDEPFGALDALTRERLNIELMRIWSQAPKTVLLVTHSISEAVFLADRVLVMSPRPGRLVADLTIELPRPRAASVKYDQTFNGCCKQLADLIYQGAEE
jgi:NitT/TauT family transport system ATP-binding protein